LKHTRILLTEMKPMLREIVRDSLVGEPDMEIVGYADDPEQVFRSIQDADVVIVGAREPNDSTLARELLRASSSTRVLAIAANGRSASMWQLRPHRVPLGEVSPASLVNAIRARSESGTTADPGPDRGITP
jgi:DNA-binding NarL/FixJ family response regulator